jgi:hypothetical protein
MFRLQVYVRLREFGVPLSQRYLLTMPDSQVENLIRAERVQLFEFRSGEIERVSVAYSTILLLFLRPCGRI